MKLWAKLWGKEQPILSKTPPPLPPCPFIPRTASLPAVTEPFRYSVTGSDALRHAKEYTVQRVEALGAEIKGIIQSSDQQLRERVGKLEIAAVGSEYRAAKKQGLTFSRDIEIIGSIMALAADSGMEGKELFETFRALKTSLNALENHQQQLETYQVEAQKAWEEARNAREAAKIEREQADQLRKKASRHARKVFLAELGIIGLLGVTAAVVITYNARYHTSNALANQAIAELGQLRTQVTRQQEYFKSYVIASTDTFTNEVNARIEENSKLRTLLAGVNSRIESTAQKVDGLDYVSNLASMLYPQVLKLQQDSQESRENQEALTRNVCSLEEQVSELKGDHSGIITDIADLRCSGATQLELEFYKLEVATRFQRANSDNQVRDYKIGRLELGLTQQQDLYERFLLQNTNSIAPGKEVEQQMKEAARMKLKCN